MEARVNFTEEFKEMTKGKGLSAMKKGKLLFDKLEEAEKNGMLQYAKSRYEVAELVGYEPHNHRGYGWVSNLINKGYIKEEFHTINGNGDAENAYYIAKRPDYKYKSSKAAARAIRKTEDNTKRIAPEIKTVTIKYGDVELIAEGYMAEEIITIVKGLR